MSDLVRYDTMHQAIIAAYEVDEVKQIRDKAEALRRYAKQSGQGIEDINRVTEIKLRAERRAGELLLEMERGSGNNQYTEQSAIVADSTSEYRAALEQLAEAGTSERAAAYWQDMAKLPVETSEQVIAETKEAGAELTTGKMLRTAAEHKRQKRAQEKGAAPPLPTDKYRIWYADPPWQYRDSGVVNPDDSYGRAARHYPTMSVEELCTMAPAIRAASEENAVLFLWATSPLVKEGIQVVEAWGFDYKSMFVWDKVAHNFGHYNSVRHELLLIATRGSCTPDRKKLFDSVVSIEKSRRHSAKPEAFRQLIDTLYPHGKRIELFARSCAPGWDAWGNECEVSGCVGDYPTDKAMCAALNG